jgi:hypothetical protein
MIEQEVKKSHNFYSPNIEANYNPGQKDTMNPINSSVFFYFFSMNSVGKNFAKMMISTAQYPNEQIKRAYASFFK